MNLLIILTTHPIQYQVPLWQALAKDGRVSFEVWYLTGHGVTASRDREFGRTFAWDLDMLSGYPHRFLKVANGATPGSFWKCRLIESLEQRMKEAGVKALWVQGWQVAAYWQAVWAAQRAGVEVWLRAESNDLAPTPFLKQMVKRVVLGQFLRRVDRFLFIGTANRRLYEKFGVPASKLHPAPYAVDNERFTKQAEAVRGQRSVVRRQWGIPDDAFCVLFCGKFIPKKRPMDIVAAARLLLQQRASSSEQRATNSALPAPGSWLPAPGSKLSKIHLLFVGSGELGSQLREACHVVFDAEAVAPGSPLQAPSSAPPSAFRPPSSETKPPASFAGFLNQTEISRAYVAADCLVLPSDYGETWGLVVNEAMASGLPCVISDHCGCAEDMARSASVRGFQTGYPAALAQQLKELLSDPRLATGAPEYISAFSFSRTVATILELAQNK